ncbi:chemotaxis protein CheB [Devosia ginsengisoli]|uniref:chemotaxis protein CheB n=1 Tax=Devosia ginsengisoli TaxID=400770 RepID=UPI0026F09E57|nr:chemotaxis protein CheB [Devosia ginsengisoli]MCR6669918.1 hypothetical protein [Devosia ginsengisoli]
MTGGTEALREVLERFLPADSPAILIVQLHAREVYLGLRAAPRCGLRHPDQGGLQDGDLVQPGQALIAPGNLHMLLVRNGQRYTIRIEDGPHVSPASSFGRRAVSVHRADGRAERHGHAAHRHGR